MQQTAVVRTENEDFESGEIGLSVKPRCLLYPLLLSINAKMMLVEAIDDVEEGIRDEYELLKDFKLADDHRMVRQ